MKTSVEKREKTTAEKAKEMENFIRRKGLESLWCKQHDCPPMELVDPLSASFPHFKGNYCCSAYLKLPQITGCLWVEKKKTLRSIAAEFLKALVALLWPKAK